MKTNLRDTIIRALCSAIKNEGTTVVIIKGSSQNGDYSLRIVSLGYQLLKGTEVVLTISKNLFPDVVFDAIYACIKPREIL